MKQEDLARELMAADSRIASEEADRLKYEAVKALGKYSDHLRAFGKTTEMYRVNRAIHMLWEVPDANNYNGPG